MEEEVLLSVKIDDGQAEKDIDNLTKGIDKLKDETNALNKANQDLTKSGQANSQQYLDNAKQIEINKIKIADNTAARKGMIQTIIAEDNSIKALQIRNSALIKQRNQITTDTKEGRKAIDDINKAIDKNNETIKNNTSALEKQRLNIGNYASALDRVIPGLGSFTTGVQSMTKSSYAFIATPLGATLAGIALVLAPLINFLKNTADGQDIMSERSAQLNAVLNVLSDRLNDVVRAFLGMENTLGPTSQKIVDFFSIIIKYTPNIISLSKLIYGLFPKEVREEIEAEAEAALQLARAFDELADKERGLIIEQKQVANEIKNLILQSKNRKISEEEKIKILEQAEQKEKELSEKIVKHRQTEFLKYLEDVKTRTHLQQRYLESNEDFAKRILVEDDKLYDGIKDNLQGYLDGLLEAEGGALNLIEAIQNKIDAADDKRIERIEKQKEEAAKARQKELEDNQKHFDDLFAQEQAQQEKNQEVDLKKAEERKKNEESFDALFNKLQVDQAKEFSDSQKKQKEIAKQVSEAKFDIAKGLANTLVGLTEEGTVAYKTAAVAETSISAFEGAQKAFASLAGIPVVGPALGAAAAAAAVVAGLARVSKILGFFEGGLVPGYANSGLSGTRIMSFHGQPINRSNGDNRLATVKTGEVILNERHQRMLGGDETFRRMGVPGFATSGMVGGFETRVASNQALQQENFNRSISEIMRSFPPVVVTVEDINAKQSQVNQVQQQAMVI